MPASKKEQNKQEKTSEKVFTTETFKVKGDKVVDKLKELFHQGNIHRIIIKNEAGKILIEIPMTLGVAGLLLLPIWVAVGTIVALATRCTIIVERRS